MHTATTQETAVGISSWLTFSTRKLPQLRTCKKRFTRRVSSTLQLVSAPRSIPESRVRHAVINCVIKWSHFTINCSYPLYSSIQRNAYINVETKSNVLGVKTRNPIFGIQAFLLCQFTSACWGKTALMVLLLRRVVVTWYRVFGMEYFLRVNIQPLFMFSSHTANVYSSPFIHTIIQQDLVQAVAGSTSKTKGKCICAYVLHFMKM